MTDTPKPLTADEIANLRTYISPLNTEYMRLIATLEQQREQIEKFQGAIEDVIDTLEAMDLHVDNPLYERLRATLEPPSEALSTTEPPDGKI